MKQCKILKYNKVLVYASYKIKIIKEYCFWKVKSKAHQAESKGLKTKQCQKRVAISAFQTSNSYQRFVCCSFSVIAKAPFPHSSAFRLLPPSLSLQRYWALSFSDKALCMISSCRPPVWPQLGLLTKAKLTTKAMKFRSSRKHWKKKFRTENSSLSFFFFNFLFLSFLFFF